MGGTPGRRGGPRRYRAGDPVTHALGEWPVLEALRRRPDRVERVVLDRALGETRRARLVAAAHAAGVPWHDDDGTLRALRHRSDALALALVRTGDDALDPRGDHLALVGTRQAGNLGVALRTALGFDVRDVALVGARVDPWSPHVIRASQGARFALRVARFADWTSYRAQHPRRAATLFAAAHAGAAATALPDWRPTRPSTLVFGPEWGGVGAAGTGVDATLVHIPQHPDLESHNLAVAVGVALYALRHGAC